MDSDKCIRCGRKLSDYDKIAHKKFVNRGADEFMCINCLAKRFDVTPDEIKERLEHFRKQGCTLFGE